MRHARRTHGFTLIEQIFTLAVAAILVAMAAPSMARLVSRSATRATEDALFTAAHLARSQAVMQATNVLLCPSHDGLHCSNKPDWQQGWIVTIDSDHDDRPDGAALARGRPDDRGVHLVGSQGRKLVRFRADGSAAGTNLTLLICPRHRHDELARSVIISNVGRIREAPASHSQQARCAGSADEPG